MLDKVLYTHSKLNDIQHIYYPYKTAMKLFVELIQIALNNRAELSQTPTDNQWQTIFALAKKQALIGITYAAIERLPATQRPSRMLLLQWGVIAERIKERNEELNNKIPAISQRFHGDGFRNLILKGQTVARYYEQLNLHRYRTPGDVDIWFDGRREDVISYVRQVSPDSHAVYHHIDYPQIDGVHIEIHFTPSWMNSYFTNKRLQQFFDESKESLFSQCTMGAESTIPMTSLAFDRVYILVHIYRHLFHEGMGLRQIMDYYFVLTQGFTEAERADTVKQLCSLKMYRFTGAIMWILQNIFGMDSKYLLVPPIEKDGRFLLQEIVISGNLGLHDQRLSRKSNDSDLAYGLRKVKRNFRFIRSYPSEVLWSPLFKVWHYIWRKHINR